MSAILDVLAYFAGPVDGQVLPAGAGKGGLLLADGNRHIIGSLLPPQWTKEG